jgi:hypothetical protein
VTTRGLHSCEAHRRSRVRVVRCKRRSRGNGAAVAGMDRCSATGIDGVRAGPHRDRLCESVLVSRHDSGTRLDGGAHRRAGHVAEPVRRSSRARVLGRDGVQLARRLAARSGCARARSHVGASIRRHRRCGSRVGWPVADGWSLVPSSQHVSFVARARSDGPLVGCGHAGAPRRAARGDRRSGVGVRGDGVEISHRRARR